MPGTYHSTTAITLAYGTLDGLDEPNPMFLFQAAPSTLVIIPLRAPLFILKNGAKAENVYWALGTAAAHPWGQQCSLEGSIISGSSAYSGMGLLLLFVAGQFIRSPSLESQRTIATSAVKCLKKLAPAFDPIEAAGKEGDVAKAKPE